MVPSHSTVSDCVAFTVEEVSQAVRQMKSGKSVGLDLTSKSLPGDLASNGGGSTPGRVFH